MRSVMYTFFAYAIPAKSHVVIHEALSDKANIHFCSGKNNLMQELKGKEYDLLFLFLDDAQAEMSLLEKAYESIPHTPSILIIPEEIKQDAEADVRTSWHIY